MSEGDTSVPVLRYDSQNDKVSFIDIQKDPLITAKTENQTVSLIKTAQTAATLQEIENSAIIKSGPDPKSAMHKAMSDVMGKTVNEALQNGADEYAILSAIHGGTKLADRHPIIDLASKVLSGAKKLFGKKAVA